MGILPPSHAQRTGVGGTGRCTANPRRSDCIDFVLLCTLDKEGGGYITLQMAYIHQIAEHSFDMRMSIDSIVRPVRLALRIHSILWSAVIPQVGARDFFWGGYHCLVSCTLVVWDRAGGAHHSILGNVPLHYLQIGHGWQRETRNEAPLLPAQ